ncbi:MAG: hypothetical protein MNPFHGCM_02608 [Gemmatimonadaceae bacterium]|nr:hypothetical protein [Gemmatimonadaceae bacterium]
MDRPPGSSKPSWPAGTVFTVGHSTRAIADFIGLLQAYDIERLADIRTVPRSRHNPQFNADSLLLSIPAAGIDYVPMRSLGGLRHARKDSPNAAWRNMSFRGYADYMQTTAFDIALDELLEASRDRRVAIMCAEAVPWRCHRSLVADALVARGILVAEILSETSCRWHSLTPFARVVGTRVTYPEQSDP